MPVFGPPPTGLSSVGVTLGTMVDECRNRLYSGALQESNALNGSIGSNDTAITLRYPLGSLQMRAAIISIGLELIRVWEWSGTQITYCDRGVNSSQAATHADRELVEVLPKFSKFAVAQAINEDLDDLCSPINGLFQVPTLELTYSPVVRGYDMANVNSSALLGIQEVRYEVPGPSKKQPLISRFSLARGMDTTDFASGMAIMLDEPAYPGLPISVRYRSTFNHLANLTDDAQTVAGIPAFANDLPPLGAALRLMAPREIKRNFDEAQPDPKLQEDVPPGSVLKSYGGLAALRQARIVACATQLLQQWGIPLRMM